FEEDRSALKRLVKLIVTEPELRLIIVEATLREITTKQDLEKYYQAYKQDLEKYYEMTKQDIKELEERLRNELDYKISALRNELKAEIAGLAERVDMLYKLMLASVLGIVITLATTILLKIIP
ncbi:MAG: hypothetical protein DRJ63_04660, partial [Thermoprotei archaeon]